jgi:hypothetical protein
MDDIEREALLAAGLNPDDPAVLTAICLVRWDLSLLGHTGSMAYDDETLTAIGELIALGEQEGFGITFEPDPAGWTVGYMRGMGGGELVTGFDLGDTARAAVPKFAYVSPTCPYLRYRKLR